jgi:glycine cleavage system H lipoate-binding protein
MAVDINKVQEIYASYFTGGGKNSGLDAKTIKLILDTYETEKLGPDKISAFLKKEPYNLDIGRSTIGRILKTGRNQNIIKPIALKDFTFFEESRRTEPRFNNIREVTNIDRTRNSNIPESAKFKVEFGRPNLDVKTTVIPEEFIGLKYFDTREEAAAALDKRKNTSFRTPAGDPQEVSYKRNKRRYENVKEITKGSSKLDKQNIKKIQGGITEINNYFKKSPELINTTPFGQNVKAMMAIRLDKDTGNFYSRLKSDDYYLQKAKDGRLFDLFDVSPVAGRKRGGRFATNVNISPNQFNRAFVQSQLTNFFNKGVNEETATQLDGILKERNIRVELPNVGRVGAAADVAFDSKTGSFPRIIKTLESMEAPDEIKNLFANTNLRKDFENNTDNVCSIFGRSKRADGGMGCAGQFDEAVQKNPQGLFQKVLNFAKSPGVKTFGIGAGVGAAIGLVKAFRNDDPTSYLSNEDQQKNMLVDMATQPITTDFERPAILDYQLPALGATLAGTTALAAPSTIKASKSRALGIERKPKGAIKTGLRVLGRGLGVAASPALLAPFMAGDIASQVAEGDSITDIATDPLNYTYPIFAEQTDKLTRGLNPTLRKAARLGLPKIALRGLSRAGIGGLGASLAIQGLGLLDD